MLEALKHCIEVCNYFYFDSESFEELSKLREIPLSRHANKRDILCIKVPSWIELCCDVLEECIIRLTLKQNYSSAKKGGVSILESRDAEHLSICIVQLKENRIEDTNRLRIFLFLGHTHE